MKYKDYRDSLIKKTVITLIPDLAVFNPAEFSNIYLNMWMQHLLSQLKRDREKSSGTPRLMAAYLSIGKISLAIGSGMGLYLDSIFQNIREGLGAKL